VIVSLSRHLAVRGRLDTIMGTIKANSNIEPRNNEAFLLELATLPVGNFQVCPQAQKR
jgi:hypothetical protein